MLEIQENYSLDRLNTLHLKSCARYYRELIDVNCLSELSDYAKTNNIKTFVLGGGSNIILPQFYNGLVIHNYLKGITLLESSADFALVKVMAGEIWDNFVLHTLQNGWFGLENLSLIPGTVGASPIQNIGAYGVEVKDFIESVEVYDTRTDKFICLSNEECQFKYRDSYLRHNSQLIVTSVVFRLLKVAKLNMNYADIAKQLSIIKNPTALDLRECVIATRQAKLPDPAIIGNAGSFFHNPILNIEQVLDLQAKYPQIPVHTLSEVSAKVSAGWLIDNLGLKGYTMGNVGVYAKQALVLVNHGDATASELLEFAKYIQEKVWNNYAIRLNIEPLIVASPNE